MVEEIFCPSCKCILRASSDDKPLCLEIVCDGGAEEDVGKVVLIVQDGSQIRCMYDREILRLPNSDTENALPTVLQIVLVEVDSASHYLHLSVNALIKVI